jgi:hypothetical protein
MRVCASRFSLLTVLAALVILSSSHAFAASSYSCELTEPPDEQLSLAHFWTFSVGDTEFGIREWRYSGNPTIGKSPRSFTTVFLGWGDLDVRLPAFTVIGFSVIGVGALGLLAAAVWSRLHRATV